MKDWIFSGEEYVCDLRVAGVLIRNERLLVQRDRGGNEYALPGGHVKIGEVMTDSLIREFMEETGAKIECLNLLWTEECFWQWNGRQMHSLCFYYLISGDFPDAGEFLPHRDNARVEYGFVPLEKLKNITVYPDFIKDRIFALADHPEHFITHA